MRYVTLDIHLDVDALHPVERRLAAEPEVTRVAMHAIKALDDGTIVLLTEVSGDLDRYRELMDSSPEVVTYAVSGTDRGYCYVHVEPSPMVERLLSQVTTEDFILKMPIEYTPDGNQRVTIIGTERDLTGVSFDLPAGFEVELVSTGEFTPDGEDILTRLTDRQREVLDTAVDLGYYEIPREATLADIADVLGIKPTTAGKHLRRVESRVFTKMTVR